MVIMDSRIRGNDRRESSRRSGVFRHMLPDDVEENLPVLPQLGLADAVHRAHLGRRRRFEPRHVDQALVREYDVGRDALLLGELEPALLERLKQRRVALGQRRGVGGRARGLAALRA